MELQQGSNGKEKTVILGQVAAVEKVIAQVIPCQGCYSQRFEILIAHGVKGRRPLENQGFLSISSAKMHKKLS